MRPALFLLFFLSAQALALSPESQAKNEPVTPFNIIGNIYYVGASDVTSYLIKTSQGIILIDGGFAETAGQIKKNISTLGFNLSDVKIILNGHAHPDHVGGIAELKRDSGATFEAMTQEIQPLEHEGKGTFYRGDRKLFESIKVDRQLHDGSTVQLGGTTLIAHLTPGHTPGCTTWTTTVFDRGRTLSVLFACQMTLPAGIALENDPAYPSVAADFENAFRVLASLSCDVFLAEHGSAFGLQAKIAKMKGGGSANVFVDPQGYRDAVRAWHSEFETELAKERQGVEEATRG
jgi:metallo-beta-lactamase class B